ncbi:hypothetical protein [Jannaschia sp. M317]|uniref:hypothetical protein n=1 Tax=Jannaschia sp. M317 TaxID=2867011 RepID=UPI0021A5CC44|nr:hypothetical protein [Jannaschia sp. M317]UWQ17392.1 hypothetical protein K3551_16135 [Jannaschia sp. M317]
MLATVPAQAQQVHECDTWQANARNIDWTDPTRTFANGAIRLVALDTEEPAAAAYHILVTFPDPEMRFLDCRLISAGEGLGYGGLFLSRANASYDPARGLTVTVPAVDGLGDARVITFTVNRATGTVTIP